MNPHLFVILVGLFYILIIGGVSLLRREGLSMQFILEALTITALATLFGIVTGTALHPIFLFIALYLVTMRARLLTDLANLLFRRRGYEAAEGLYRLALRLYPDQSSRFIVRVNWGIARLMSGDIPGAIRDLEQVLAAEEEQGGLGHKYEAACRYNLAIAHSKAGNDVAAVRQFTQVTDLFPASVYGHAAERALQARRGRGSTEPHEKD